MADMFADYRKQRAETSQQVTQPSGGIRLKSSQGLAKVFIQTRNPSSFKAWLKQLLARP